MEDLAFEKVTLLTLVLMLDGYFLFKKHDKSDEYQCFMQISLPLFVNTLHLFLLSSIDCQLIFERNIV